MLLALLRAKASRRCAACIESEGNAPCKSAAFCMGKKKMRNLGTVQLPTEAFMAVLKPDSD